MQTKSKRVVLFLVLASIPFVIAGGIYGWWHWKFPYGHRACFMPCMLNALRLHADANGGAFPDGTNSYAALQKLFPTFMPSQQNFAGISGDIDATSRAIAYSRVLTSNESSWVYIKGLKASDGDDLMILYERTPGVSGNGAKASGHAVGFCGGHTRMIPDAEWGSFLAEQAKLRARLQPPP
jgi:hypothetical protein